MWLNVLECPRAPLTADFFKVFLGPVAFEALTIAAIDEMSGVGEARGAALRVSLRVGGHLLEHLTTPIYNPSQYTHLSARLDRLI